MNLAEGVPVLTRTPAVLDAWLRDLPDVWARANEGPDTFSAFDVLGHLIHGERADWIPRARIIREQGETRPFDKFDRFAMYRESEGKKLNDLLDAFAELRRANLATLAGWRLTPQDLERRGRHPELGAVTLGQLLATWVAHDLGHLGQVARVMAKRYKAAVGPWVAYLPILTRY